jgi:acyl carrier protein
MAVIDELKKNLARVARVPEDSLKPETALKDIKADSLHWVQIIVALETAYDIEVDIDKERMAELATVADFAAYVEQFIK